MIIESSFRLISEPVEVEIAADLAKEDFLERLAMHGFTVLPDVQKKWWKYAE